MHLFVKGRDDPVRLLVDELDAVLVVRELYKVPLDLLALVLLLSTTTTTKKHTHTYTAVRIANTQNTHILTEVSAWYKISAVLPNTLA